MKTNSKKVFALAVVLGLLVNSITFVATVTPVAASGKVPVIIDMDMSGDIDDLGDITVLNALANLDEVEIIAVLGTSGNTASSLLGGLIGQYHGNIYPTGWIADGSGAYGPGAYPAELISEFGYTGQNEDGVALYKRVLAAQPDSSVVIVTTGGLEGLRQLMLNDGMGIIQQKVKMLICAGGQYPTGGEYNFTCWPQGAEYVINNWPVEAYYSDYWWGHDARTGNNMFINNQLAPDSRADNPTVAGYKKYIPIETNGVAGYWSGSYPTWAQVAVLYAARYDSGAQQMYARNETGYNFVRPNGVNDWKTDRDPGGRQNQGYLIPRSRWEVQDTLDTLFKNSNNPKSKGTRAVPNKPTDIRATVGGGSVTLTWMDNSWNETHFQIDYFNPTTNSWTSAGTAPANTKTFNHTPVTTAGAAYRVSSVNSLGNSEYAYRQVTPGGWSVLKGSDPYVHYQDGSLYWPRDREVAVNEHMMVNNDIITGNTFTADMKVTSKENYGDAHFYFLVQDANNWYRITAVAEQSGRPSGVWPPTKVQPSKLEKCVNGNITQVGPNLDLWNGSEIETWKLVVDGNNIKFYWDNHYRENKGGWWGANPLPEPVLALEVNENLQWQSGKIGIGGSARGYSCKPEWGEIVVTGSTEIPQHEPVTGVTVSPKTATIAVSGTQQLTANVQPSNASNKAVEWTSSNTDIATVNSSGLVTGVSNGAATITVRTSDGGFTDTCTVTVSGTVTPPPSPTPTPTQPPLPPGTLIKLTDSIDCAYNPPFFNSSGYADITDTVSGGSMRLHGIPSIQALFGLAVPGEGAYWGNATTSYEIIPGAILPSTEITFRVPWGTQGRMGITAINYTVWGDAAHTVKIAEGTFNTPAGNGSVFAYDLPGGPFSNVYSAEFKFASDGFTPQAVFSAGGAATPMPTASSSPTPDPSATPSTSKLTWINTMGTTREEAPDWYSGPEKAFDGNEYTYCEIVVPGGSNFNPWIAVDFGSPKIVSYINFLPRANYSSRFIGWFEGANNEDFSDAVKLAEVTSAPPAGWNSIYVSGNTAFRYVRFVGDVTKLESRDLNVCEIEFHGSTPQVSREIVISGTTVERVKFGSTPLYGRVLTAAYKDRQLMELKIVKVSGNMGSVNVGMSLPEGTNSVKALIFENENTIMPLDASIERPYSGYATPPPYPTPTPSPTPCSSTTPWSSPVPAPAANTVVKVWEVTTAAELKNALEAHSYFDGTGDGEAGREGVVIIKNDIVLDDPILMPGMGGLQNIKRVVATKDVTISCSEEFYTKHFFKPAIEVSQNVQCFFGYSDTVPANDIIEGIYFYRAWPDYKTIFPGKITFDGSNGKEGSDTTTRSFLSAIASKVAMHNVTFKDCWSGDQGGAMWINQSKAYLYNSKFTGNASANQGGAICINSGLSEVYVNEGCEFTGNEAKGQYAYGGAISAFEMYTLKIAGDTLFKGNKSANGSVIGTYGHTRTLKGSVTIEGGTFDGDGSAAGPLISISEPGHELFIKGGEFKNAPGGQPLIYFWSAPNTESGSGKLEITGGAFSGSVRVMPGCTYTVNPPGLVTVNVQ